MQRIVDADKATLEHWGIKGMKWRVRRFQNKDGSLTAAGRKRYSDSAEGGKSTSASNKSKSSSSSGKSSGKLSSASKSSSSSEEKQDPVIKKKPSEMTDEELNAAINRLNLEKKYMDLLPKPPAPTPKQKRLVTRIFEKTRDDVVIPALTQSAKNALSAWLEKSFKDALGLNSKNDDDSLKALKERVDRLNLEERQYTIMQQRRQRAKNKKARKNKNK